MTDHSPEQKEMPFVQHLVELRGRLLKIILAVGLILLVLIPFANPLFTFLAEPLLRFLPETASMIAIDVISPFFTPFKLVIMLSIFLAVPAILYHIWAFVAPGLYENEKALVLPLLVSSTFLFYLGMAFAYYVVFPIMFNFMASTAPEGVKMMPDISRYLDLILKLFFAFGVAFQVPVVTIVLVSMDMISTESLTEKRPYIIVMAFTIGMLMTPPDVISQTLLAVPMWLLFELGLFIARLLQHRKQSASSTDKSTALTMEDSSKQLMHQDPNDRDKQ